MILSLLLASSGGFWAPIADPLASVLAYFYDLVPNYGIAIVLLTLAMMVVLIPLTIKQTRSMLVMQKLQPEMKRLQEQHKNDRQALNEAIMALYKEHNASPLGGCLPMLLPFPLFIALLRVLDGLSHKVHNVSMPNYLNSKTAMYQNIVKAHGKLDAFGMDLAKTARHTGGGFLHTLPYFVLLLLMVGTQFYQQHQLTSKNPAMKSQPGQAMMMKFIPLVFGVFAIAFPAGVIVYWTVSNVFRIGQQWALYRYDPKVKALVSQDVREVEAKTREIDAAGGKSARPRFRDMLNNASQAAAERRGAPGKSDAKPAGRAPGSPSRNGTPAGGKRPAGATPAKAGGPQKGSPQKGSPQKGSPQKGSPQKGGPTKAPVAKAGAATAGAVKADASRSAPKGGANKGGVAAKAGSGAGGKPAPAKTTAAKGAVAAKAGSAGRAGSGAGRPGAGGAPTAGAGRPGTPKGGPKAASQPGADSSKAPLPASKSAALSPSREAPGANGDAPVATSAGAPTPDSPTAPASSMATGAAIEGYDAGNGGSPVSPVGPVVEAAGVGTNGGNGRLQPSKAGGADADGRDEVGDAGDGVGAAEVAASTQGAGTASPAGNVTRAGRTGGGRTGAGSARAINSHRRRKGR